MMTNLPWQNEKEFYDLHSKGIFSRFPFYHVSMIGKTKEEFLEYIIQKAKINENSNVVDLGCGSGYVAASLNKICSCVGISTSSECISQCLLNYPNGKYEIANMENYQNSKVTHFLALESIGYSNISITLKNVFTNLTEGGIFYVKDLVRLYKESEKEEANRKYWEKYWCYNSFSVPEIIRIAYLFNFKLLEFNDITSKINSQMFRESLKYNKVEFTLPYPKVNFLLAAEFIFVK